METTVTSRSLEGRKGRQSDKSGVAKTQSTVDSSTLKEKALLHPSHDKLPLGPITTKEVTEDEMKGPHSMEGDGMLTKIIERQEPAAVTVSPLSSAVDDTWDFLSDPPQEIDQQV